jgi:hypothetical protein
MLICFAYKDSQKFLDDFLQSIGGLINQDARMKLIGAFLMLILKCCIVTFCYH